MTKALPWIALVALLAAVGSGDAYVLTLGATSALTVMAAIALNFSMGLAGSVNIGVGVFYGVGAYAAALLNTRYGLSILSSMAIAVLLSVVMALVIGPLLLRTRSLYFAIATLAFNGIFIDIVASTSSLGGELGIAGIMRPEPFAIFGPKGDPSALRTVYVYVAVSLVLMLAAFAFIKAHKLGRTLEAIREDELLCKSLGYSTLLYRTAAFVMTAALAAVAGVLYAFVIQYVSPGPFSFLAISFQAFVIVAVGGAATVWGPVLAGLAIVALPNLLEFSATTNQYIYGAILLVIVIFMPGGLAAGLGRLGAMVRRPAAGGSGHSLPSH